MTAIGGLTYERGQNGKNLTNQIWVCGNEVPAKSQPRTIHSPSISRSSLKPSTFLGYRYLASKFQGV